MIRFTVPKNEQESNVANGAAVTYAEIVSDLANDMLDDHLKRETTGIGSIRFMFPQKTMVTKIIEDQELGKTAIIGEVPGGQFHFPLTGESNVQIGDLVLVDGELDFLKRRVNGLTLSIALVRDRTEGIPRSIRVLASA